jgi:hypothetical protein
VVTPDLRKLAAPMVAQAVSFVAVLAVGAFVASSPPKVHVTPPKPHPSALPAAVSTFEMVVQAIQTKANVALAGRRVNVLRDGTLASGASGALNQEGLFTSRVPAGSYQVCLRVPADQEPAHGSTSGLPGWACYAVQVQAGTGTIRVTFSLVPKPVRKDQK